MPGPTGLLTFTAARRARRMAISFRSRRIQKLNHATEREQMTMPVVRPPVVRDPTEVHRPAATRFRGVKGWRVSGRARSFPHLPPPTAGTPLESTRRASAFTVVTCWIRRDAGSGHDHVIELESFDRIDLGHVDAGVERKVSLDDEARVRTVGRTRTARAVVRVTRNDPPSSRGDSSSIRPRSLLRFGRRRQQQADVEPTRHRYTPPMLFHHRQPEQAKLSTRSSAVPASSAEPSFDYGLLFPCDRPLRQFAGSLGMQFISSGSG